MIRIEKKRIKRLLSAVLCLLTVLSLLVGTAPWDSAFVVRAAEVSSPIALRRINGSGEAFIYHSFVETTEFTTGQTYAFLNGIYGDADAVSSLGAGAILQATATNNNSSRYIKNKYGTSAAVKVYVDVITPGKDFDHCVVGGLYEVPNSGTPTEYRYFCGFGGAQNCGPYYAYHYEKESVTSVDVSASLKSIEKQGSENSEDYTVTITYDGNQVWLKLRILDEEDHILAETGLLKPNEFVRTVTFETVPENRTNIKLKIMAYEPDTYDSAGAVTLNTTL